MLYCLRTKENHALSLLLIPQNACCRDYCDLLAGDMSREPPLPTPNKNLLGSFSNHDDDGHKNPTNLHIWQWKIVFLHALHVHISFLSHLVDVLDLSTTWNDQFCSCVDDVSIWWQMFNFVFLCPKRWFQFNSRIIRTQFSIVMILNNWEISAETQSFIFRWRSCFSRRRVCLSSLLFLSIHAPPPPPPYKPSVFWRTFVIA